jgi:hypothetical protein
LRGRLGDNFYNADAYRFGLARYFHSGLFDGPTVTLQLYILPLAKDAPIYISAGWPDFGNSSSVLSLDGIDVEQDADTDFIVAA